MNSALFTTIAATGFTVAFFHAAIPTHWLPFVLTARVQKWNKSKTLLDTTLAGCGHVLFTAALGFLVAWCGIKLSDKIGGWFPWIAGGALIAFGLYSVIQQIRGKGHGHSHPDRCLRCPLWLERIFSPNFNSVGRHGRGNGRVHLAHARRNEHGIGHSHAPKDFHRGFAIGVFLNLALVVAQVIFGLIAHSLALVADAGHNFADVLGLVLAWWASKLAKSIPTKKHTYGLRSVSILAALANAVLLLTTMGAVAWEAIVRLKNPPDDIV